MKRLPTIKERLINRFNGAREAAGPDWKKRIATEYPEFNTYEGGRILELSSSLNKRPNIMSADKLETLVLALEKLAGIKSMPVV